MPMRKSRGKRNVIKVSSDTSPSYYGSAGTMRSYAKEQTGVKRHQYNSAVLGSGAIATGLYQIIPIVQMKRTFTVNNDEEDSPTQGSNYETPDVMNGSYVTNFDTTLHIHNKTNTNSGWLTVYEIALSYYDALIWNTLMPSNCPVQFDTASVGPPDHRGEVTIKTPSLNLIDEDVIKSHRFQQRYIRELGKVYVPHWNEGGKVDIKLNDIPSKCKRVQQGTFYGIVLFNDPVVNSSASVVATTSMENSFDEIPSSNRFAYLS